MLGILTGLTCSHMLNGSRIQCSAGKKSDRETYWTARFGKQAGCIHAESHNEQPRKNKCDPDHQRDAEHDLGPNGPRLRCPELVE